MKDSIADAKLKLFINYCRRMPDLWERMEEVSERLNGFGIKSPKIRSKEEALYTSGPKIYSEKPLLDLICQEEELQKKYKTMQTFCNEIGRVLVTMDEQEIDLLYRTYERNESAGRIGIEYGYTRSTITRKLEDALHKFE